MEKEKKKGNRTFVFVLIIIVIFGVFGVGAPLLLAKIQKSQERKVPNLIGKTFEEAQKELESLDLKLEETLGNNNKDSIITNQETQYSAKKGDTIKVSTKSQEEVEKQNQADKEYQEKKNAVSNAIRDFAKSVEEYNSGSVKYKEHESYLGIKTSIGTYKTVTKEDVYKIKYTTSSEYSYYYQLVSLTEDNTSVKKSTKLFPFNDYSGTETGATQELEYAYESTFGE